MAVHQNTWLERGLTQKLLVALGLIFGAYILLVLVQPFFFGDRFGMDSQIAGVNVSGKTAAEAKTALTNKWNEYNKTNILVHDQEVLVTSLISSANVDETVEDALSQEQSGYFSFSKVTPQTHEMNLEYNKTGVSDLLLSEYDKVATAPKDAVITNLNTGTIAPEINGQRLALGESRELLLSSLRRMPSSAGLVLTEQRPVLTEKDATALLGDVQSALDTPISLDLQGEQKEISANTLHSWLKITPISPVTLVSNEPFWFVSQGQYNYLDPSKVYNYVSYLANTTDVKVRNATLSMNGGNLGFTSKSVTGETMDQPAANNDIQVAVKGEHSVKLSVNEQKPEVREDNLSGLGIKELISTGQTDAAGSPKNRIVNYTVGSSKFNGVLIKPGENFSFNKALGNVDASTGYLPELVILENKTVPEYGGGLCQVSSTAFRAALNAGLPINERHWHAYPVGYYKPYGVDATIYLPSPDLKFTNDTGKYILIQTRIEGTKVYFDFYGTKKPVVIKFSGNENATGAVDQVEKITPTLSEQDARGPKSFTAVFYRHIYDLAGKLTDNDKFTSKYDSPDKYPH